MIARRRRTNSGSDSKESGVPGYQHQRGTTVVEGGISPPRLAAADPEMTCRDRTVEFKSAVKSLQTRQGNGVVPQRPSPSRDLRQRSQFAQIAKRIGRDLANTYAKLEKLTILAKRKSLFDDKPFEIQELTAIIKQDMGSLNKQIAQLQEFANSQRSHNVKHVQSHSNSVVVALQSKLATMTSDFKTVLEVRTENMKQQKSRREQFSQSGSAVSLPPSALNGHTGSVLLKDEEASGRGDVAIDMDGLDRNGFQQQLQLTDQQDAYIEERANTMQEIESTIVELGSIFQQLAHLVKEQEEMVTRIDSNVEDTHMNIEAAHSEILKYFQSVTSNRWLMIKIFAVLIIFFIIFVVFMA